jgi:hypothetical protein
MRKTTSAILALCAVAALAGRAEGPDPEPPAGAKAELKKLQGTWVTDRALFKKREHKLSGQTKYTFDGDKLTRAVPVRTAAGDRFERK